MTFEKILTDLSSNKISPKDASNEISKKDKRKIINFYIHKNDISKDPLTDLQLQEVNAIVNILQILYQSPIDSPISDSEYDILQEMIIDMGIPRLSGSIELSSGDKIHHKYKNLRGSLDKVYYLSSDEKRTNKSRKYLDEWIKKMELRYKKITGKEINLNDVKVLLQPKFDGSSCILENDINPIWITRGDTHNNLATDVSHIMKIFNDIYAGEKMYGIKFEVMIPEESKDKINELYKSHPYHNSRQIVTSILNSNEPDFKVDYLYPVPLRIIYPNEEIESIHPDLIKKFPTKICLLGDRDIIRQFANEHRYVNINGVRLRTDGVVMTITNPEIQKILGRENHINNFEVAYKFTEEVAYSKVKNIEFYISDFGFITPVLVINDVILKGNTINRISLSNKERFDELEFCYGDEVKILYDIIPYATIDEKCRRAINGRKIPFVKECPRCHEPLDLSKIQVRCNNPRCPSKIIGRILNYCTNLRMQNIGYQTLDVLYAAGLLNHGIRSLYKLKKKKNQITNLEGFGQAKTSKIITEIESKRKLNDYDFFGSLGIDTLSIKTFQLIFSNLSFTDFLNMIKVKNFNLLYAKLILIKGIGEAKSKILIDYLKDKESLSELRKLMKEVTIYETYGKTKGSKGRIVFSGLRPWEHLTNALLDLGYEASESWSNHAKLLVIPSTNYTSSKVTKAQEHGIPIMVIPKTSNEVHNKMKQIEEDQSFTTEEKKEKILELKTLSFLMELTDHLS